MRVGVALQGSIVLRAVTIYRPETQTDNLKLKGLCHGSPVHFV